MAELADAADSKSAAVRRGGSNPSARTAAQQLHDWNTAIFEEARRKREKAFDALLQEHNNRSDTPAMPTLW